MKNLFQTELTNAGSLLILVLIVSAVIVLLSYLLSESKPDVEKLSVYECGFDPYEDARNVFDVRFYLVAILFIIFDLETVFFYPWCISIDVLSVGGFWSMIDFFVELLAGFYYAWISGALDWE